LGNDKSQLEASKTSDVDMIIYEKDWKLKLVQEELQKAIKEEDLGELKEKHKQQLDIKADKLITLETKYDNLWRIYKKCEEDRMKAEALKERLAEAFSDLNELKKKKERGLATDEEIREMTAAIFIRDTMCLRSKADIEDRLQKAEEGSKRSKAVEKDLADMKKKLSDCTEDWAVLRLALKNSVREKSNVERELERVLASGMRTEEQNAHLKSLLFQVKAELEEKMEGMGEENLTLRFLLGRLKEESEWKIELFSTCQDIYKQHCVAFRDLPSSNGSLCYDVPRVKSACLIRLPPQPIEKPHSGRDDKRVRGNPNEGTQQ